VGVIPNHIAPKLSDLDLWITRSVPPGGNWKDIPHEIPSQRLKQIRESYARGEGSRSTYYGRLHPHFPAYTISTYFPRPGNGCHIHYDPAQNRTISYREAARLQSFPDSFVFEGPHTSVCRQIGNAVPPLLGFAIARCFPTKGKVVDLFAGAGGLALGFSWANWEVLVSNDIDENALRTHARNLSAALVVGDIRDDRIRAQVVALAQAKRNAPEQPLVVLGGPPCQGFSTAGNRRTRDDDRNQLFKDYIRFIESIQPDAFLFENVPGILNMDAGSVFAEIREELAKHCKQLDVWKVAAEQFGVPQRRHRVILVGFRTLEPFALGLGPLQSGLFGGPPISVEEAIADLPPLISGQDGTQFDYSAPALTGYQALMRGDLAAEQFFARLPLRRDREQNAVSRSLVAAP
jgi:DNA (cytosine-5)-methyltransferase 1